MSIVTNVFSALGNNSSLYPIIFKDSVDNTGRVMMAYKEGSKGGKHYGMHDARERFIEENTTSLVWLGGIPGIKLLYDRLVTNKLYNFANFKELGSTFDKEGKRVLSNTDLKLLSKGGVQNLKDNVDGIREAAQNNQVLNKLVKEADKILENPTKFQKTQVGKILVSTIVPLVTVGFLLPRFIQKTTKKIYGQEQKAAQQKKQAAQASNFIKGNPPVFSAIMDQPAANKKVSFGNKLGNAIIGIFNNNVSNQVILDAGISSGRVITGVNKADKIEKGIKEAGVVFFIYLGGKVIANALEKVGKAIGLPISLDSQILEDKNFQNKILDIAKASTPEQKATLTNELLNFAGNDEKSILSFIDNQVVKGVKDNTFSNTTLKAAQKLGVVDLVEGVKNPLKFIDTKKIKELNESIGEFATTALKKESVADVEKFLKKALNAKRAGIALNLIICSVSTAFILPKLQYMFREKYTNSTNLPSLAEYDKQFEKEKAFA